MAAIAQENFTDNFFTLLKETFEGPPPQTASAYLDQGGGLLQTLEQVTPETASRPVHPGANTIAAHCEHVRFYLAVLDRSMHGNTEQADWKQSWLVQTVNPSEWDTLKKELRQAYTKMTEHLQSVESWGDTPIGEGLAILTHTAYHLGAIRQLLRMLASDL